MNDSDRRSAQLSLVEAMERDCYAIQLLTALTNPSLSAADSSAVGEMFRAHGGDVIATAKALRIVWGLKAATV